MMGIGYYAKTNYSAKISTKKPFFLCYDVLLTNTYDSVLFRIYDDLSNIPLHRSAVWTIPTHRNKFSGNPVIQSHHFWRFVFWVFCIITDLMRCSGAFFGHGCIVYTLYEKIKVIRACSGFIFLSFFISLCFFM